tara:strand:+ start:391 stop:771 length:381 start_codon:yes stop_codon:yes gene_type:complete
MYIREVALNKFFGAVFVLWPAGLLAQPYSESMADCAAIYQNAAQWVESEASAEQLMFAARRWAAAAVVQTAAEGQPMSERGMWDKVDRKTGAWGEKGAMFALTTEFRDWTSYCRSFAKDRGIEIRP